MLAARALSCPSATSALPESVAAIALNASTSVFASTPALFLPTRTFRFESGAHTRAISAPDTGSVMPGAPMAPKSLSSQSQRWPRRHRPSQSAPDILIETLNNQQQQPSILLTRILNVSPLFQSNHTRRRKYHTMAVYLIMLIKHKLNV